MAFDESQITELKHYYPDIVSVNEGGTAFILIRNLKLPKGCTPEIVNALLCPSPRDGYTSRLFLSQQIAHAGQGKNWNAAGVVIAGQKWWAVSWKTGQANLRFLGMVIAHLLAFT